MNSLFLKAQQVILGHSERRPLSSDPIDLSLPDGLAVALIGPNGSGKSTFIRAILGEKVTLSGSITLSGLTNTVAKTRARDLKDYIGLVPQEHPVHIEMRVSDLLRVSYLNRAGLFGSLPGPHHPEVLPTIEKLRLTKLVNTLLSRLSTGERQRVFLARALLQRPQLLLLDEPTNHLDPLNQKLFWSALCQERKLRPFNIIFSSHDMESVREHAEWVCGLKQGNLVFSGKKALVHTQENLNGLFATDPEL